MTAHRKPTSPRTTSQEASRDYVLTGTWSVTEGYLVSTFTFGDTTVSIKEDYSIRSDTLILVDRAQGSMEKWLQL